MLNLNNQFDKYTFRKLYAKCDKLKHSAKEVN